MIGITDLMPSCPGTSFEPTDLELRYFAKDLGVECDAALAKLIKREIAKLPGMWVVLTHAEDGALLYLNNDTGEVTWEHPRRAEISKLVSSSRLDRKKRGEGLRWIEKTDEEFIGEMQEISNQYQERLWALREDSESDLYSAYQKHIQDTRNTEEKIRTQLEEDYACERRRLKDEAAYYEKVEMDRIDADATRERQMFHANFQISQSHRNRVTLDEVRAKSFMPKAELEEKHRDVLRFLTEALQMRKRDTTLAVGEYEKYRAELEAQKQKLVELLMQRHHERKHAKLKKLEEYVNRYREFTGTDKIESLKIYLASYADRLEAEKETLMTAFQLKKVRIVSKLTTQYHSKSAQIKHSSEQKLQSELNDATSSQLALLNSQANDLQEKYIDKVLRASATLTRNRSSSQTIQRIEELNRKIADAHMLLIDRNKTLQQATSKLLTLHEQAIPGFTDIETAPPEEELHVLSQQHPSKSPVGHLVTSPKLMIRSSFSDRLSAPTSTKASTGKNAFQRGCIDFGAEDSYREDEDRDVFTLERSYDEFTCDLAPSVSLPIIRQSIDFSTRLLSRQAQTRAGLKANLNRHSCWMKAMQSELINEIADKITGLTVIEP